MHNIKNWKLQIYIHWIAKWNSTWDESMNDGAWFKWCLDASTFHCDWSYFLFNRFVFQFFLLLFSILHTKQGIIEIVKSERKWPKREKKNKWWKWMWRRQNLNNVAMFLVDGFRRIGIENDNIHIHLHIKVKNKHTHTHTINQCAFKYKPKHRI